MNPVKSMQAARAAGVPVIVINTLDQPALIKTLVKNLPETAPAVTWDSVRGFSEMNALGKTAIKAAVPGNASDADCQDPQFALGVVARKFDKETVLFVMNAQRILKEDQWAQVAQAVSIIRTEYLKDHRKLVLIGPSVIIPSELRSDTILVEDELPSDEQIGAILDKLHKNVGIEAKDREKLIGIGRGLSAFSAEQVFALSMRKEGLDIEEAWQQKRAAVGQVPGLRMELGGPTLDEFIGYDAVANMARLMFAGPKPPTVIVVMDEIEKQLAGAFGDSHDGGVAKDSFSTILKWMNDDDHDGQINIGLGGTGKTMFATALGATFGIPTIHFDNGAMRGELVGQSERMVREAVKMITSIAGKSGAYVVATCNGFGKMPPEMKRRFHSAFWYFEPPNREARAAMWKHYAGKFGIKLPKAIAWDALWTGAEIRNCCRNAWKYGLSVDDARHYIVPVAESDHNVLEQLRKQADGKLLDASEGGKFDSKKVAADGDRAMSL